MKLDKLNQWLTLAANLAVLAGIIFLALEINQNTASMRIDGVRDRNTRLIDQSSLIVESSILSEALAKVLWRENRCNPNPELIQALNEQEKIVISEYLKANWFRIDNLREQYESGVYDREFFENAALSTLANIVPWLDAFEVPHVLLARRVLEYYSFTQEGGVVSCAFG